MGRPCHCCRRTSDSSSDSSGSATLGLCNGREFSHCWSLVCPGFSVPGLHPGCARLNGEHLLISMEFYSFGILDQCPEFFHDRCNELDPGFPGLPEYPTPSWEMRWSYTLDCPDGATVSLTCHTGFKPLGAGTYSATWRAVAGEDRPPGCLPWEALKESITFELIPELVDLNCPGADVPEELVIEPAECPGEPGEVTCG